MLNRGLNTKTEPPKSNDKEYKGVVSDLKDALASGVKQVDEILSTKHEKIGTPESMNLLEEFFSVIPSGAYRDSLNTKDKNQNKTEKKETDLTLRTMADSYLEIHLNFKDDLELLKQYENAWGEIKVGKVMEDLDKLAAGIGYKYCNEKVASSHLTIVTASVDRIAIHKRINPEKNYRLGGHVSYVGYSSMEIFIKMEEIDPNKIGTNEAITLSNSPAILEAKFTMVARDKYTKRASQLHPLLVRGDREKKLFNDGLASKARKMATVQKSLTKAPPTAEERLLVHDLYLESLKYLDETSPMPSNVKWMSSTQLQSVTVCQPQDRNVHNFIFGGYLMRLAFQLAWVTGYNYIGTVPRFLASDEILFRKSVPIGSILTLTSKVAHTPEKHDGSSSIEDSLLQVSVQARVISPDRTDNGITNTFHFTFQTPDSDQFPVPRVLPKSYAECMEYLEARRKRLTVDNS
ncbi:Thioesterase/thiol ester dehydrase-isomerase [Neoconidiobolus thromboides FSU 785]|nr:Thioesterase/thiol ester dehydrase-isomerase [Neoconidiobolus thromboides FSU 785]